MATIETSNITFQHFSASAGDTVIFTRPITNLFFTVTVNTLTMSMDGGSNFMNINTGTYEFTKLPLNTLVFGGSGSITGVGVSL